jgi:hypothetical protein
LKVAKKGKKGENEHEDEYIWGRVGGAKSGERGVRTGKMKTVSGGLKKPGRVRG